MHNNLQISAALEKYKNLILKWNKVHNLISKNSEEFIDERHINDSLRICEMVNINAENICDFGSGAGFPAIPLSIYLNAQGANTKIYMYESRQKKASFLQLCIDELELSNTRIVNDRIENAQKIKADYITARAFAGLKEIFDYSKGFAEESTIFLLHKGEKTPEEINLASKFYSFDVDLFDKNEKNGVILLASNVKPK